MNNNNNEWMCIYIYIYIYIIYIYIYNNTIHKNVELLLHSVSRCSRSSGN